MEEFITTQLKKPRRTANEIKQQILAHLKEKEIKHSIKQISQEFNIEKTDAANYLKQLAEEKLIDFEEIEEKSGRVTTHFKIKSYFVKKATQNIG